MLNSFHEINVITDLSHSIHPKMMIFSAPWHRKVEFETLGEINSVGRRTTHLHFGTHVGTHVDAPSHFIEKGMPINEIALHKFIGPATCLDLSSTKPGTEVNVEDLKKALGDTEPSKRVILYFNWSKFFGHPSFYSEQPYLGEGAADWLLQYNPELIGYDLAMPDNPLNGKGSECDSPMHKKFLELGIPLLESMKINYCLPKKFYLSALPLSLENLDGSPVRCVALL